jgi:hypothetical protein
MNFARRHTGFSIVLLLSLLFSGCITIDEVVQPSIVNVGQTIAITMHVKIPQTRDRKTNRVIFAFLAPRDWNVGMHSTITYSSDKGEGKMTLIPPGVVFAGFDKDWPEALIKRFRIGVNLVKDMEWVTFQSDQTYASTNDGPEVNGVLKIVTKAGMENEMVRLGYFVTTDEGIDPANSPFYGKDIHVIGGRGQLIDFSHPQISTIVPVRSLENDYITMTFDGNARQTPLTVSNAIFLHAIAYTSDQRAINVDEKTTRTKLAPIGDNKWCIQIWPRSFFKLKNGQSLRRIEYYFTNHEGIKVGYDKSDNPFRYEFSVD